MLEEFTAAVLLIVAGLFPVINPPAAGFIMMSLIPQASPTQLAHVAWRVSVNGLVILLASLTIGAYVLSFFGISIPVLRLAGGLVIAVSGWNLLKSPTEVKKEQVSAAASEDAEAASIDSKVFYPLTLPITVGPGSISVAIALGSRSPKSGLSVAHLAGVGVGLAILTVSIYLCLRFAGKVEKLLGTVGTEIAIRLFSFILFCIGVQICWLGLSELLESVKWR